MPFPWVAFVLAQSRADTLGKTNAQILAMGHTAWYRLYTQQRGESTADMTSADGLYGDALAWRNDRLLKRRKSPLREHLRAFSNDAQGVGYETTGGGTMWNITAASLYVRLEETLYAVTTHSGKPPHRVVSEVSSAIARLRHAFEQGDTPTENRPEGRAALKRLEADLWTIVADARRLSRHDSDTVLEFCRSVAADVAAQAGGN